MNTIQQYEGAGTGLTETYPGEVGDWVKVEDLVDYIRAENPEDGSSWQFCAEDLLRALCADDG